MVDDGLVVQCVGCGLGGSGWLSIVSNAKVTGPGNQYLLTGKEVAKTKYVHQVTACVLYRLMKCVYKADVERADMTFDSWGTNMEKISPQFQYWSIPLKMEMALFLFTRSIRSRNFVL